MLRRLTIVLLLALSAFAQQPGQLAPKIDVADDAQQSYALYLPKNYDRSHRWPVIYILDPGARGAAAAEHFKLAAEQYGYVVAASNVSRNGPMKPSMSALEAMTRDVETRFSVDARRRYIAGFSGGARAAFLAAHVCEKCFTGVIGCGAGLPQNLQLKSAPPFAYAAIVGNYDFNFAEVTGLVPTLDSARATYRITTFDGTHEWPPAEVLADAIGWIEFQAAKSGTVTRPASSFAQDFRQRSAAAQALANRDPLQAEREYDSILRDFTGTHDTAEISKSVAQLRSSSEYKKAQKNDRAVARRVDEQASSFEQSLSAYLGPTNLDSRQSTYSNLFQIIDHARADSRSKDSVTSTAGRRALSSFLVSVFQASGSVLPDREVELAELSTIIRPESAEAYYWLALAHLRAGHKKPALSALKKSVELGTPKSKLRDDTRLKPLAEEAEFAPLVRE